MQVSIFAAFLAGLISFLSPCVLPLVPGYISMLSGIGVEQLRQGERPRSSLFASSLAFVIGFSVVFITFGASASAVGQFLVRNRSLLAPFAGAVIVLFGLHLIGWLGRIPVRGGLLIGGALLALAAVVWIWLGGDEVCGIRTRAADLRVVDFSRRPDAHPLAESRRSLPQSGWASAAGA